MVDPRKTEQAQMVRFSGLRARSVISYRMVSDPDVVGPGGFKFLKAHLRKKKKRTHKIMNTVLGCPWDMKGRL